MSTAFIDKVKNFFGIPLTRGIDNGPFVNTAGKNGAYLHLGANLTARDGTKQLTEADFDDILIQWYGKAVYETVKSRAWLHYAGLMINGSAFMALLILLLLKHKKVLTAMPYKDSRMMKYALTTADKFDVHMILCLMVVVSIMGSFGVDVTNPNKKPYFAHLMIFTTGLLCITTVFVNDGNDSIVKKIKSDYISLVVGIILISFVITANFPALSFLFNGQIGTIFKLRVYTTISAIILLVIANYNATKGTRPKPALGSGGDDIGSAFRKTY